MVKYRVITLCLISILIGTIFILVGRNKYLDTDLGPIINEDNIVIGRQTNILNRNAGTYLISFGSVIIVMGLVFLGWKGF